MYILRTVVWLCLYVFWVLPVAAQQSVTSPHVRVSLISEHSSYHSGVNWIGIRFDLDPDWHVYWKNPGDSGAAPRFTFELPPEVTADEMQWPTPKKIPIAHLVNFGYEGSVVLLVPVKVPQEFRSESLSISAKGEWLVCKEDCVPGEGSFSIDLPRNDAPVERSPTAEFELLRKKIPKRFPGTAISFAITSTEMRVQLPKELREGAPFLLPIVNGIIKNAAPQSIDDHGLLSVTRDATGIVPEETSALLLGGSTVQITLVNSAPRSQKSASTVDSPLLIYIVFAFLGGIILNLMPCVLPVIGIKVFSLIDHAQSSAKLRNQYGLLFLAGVILSLWGIWGAVMAARSIGVSLGWGFQLQEPWFVIFLIVVLTLLALNLLGIFEVGASIQRIFGKAKGRTPNAEALLSGLLTTLVATPCTAPFMGTSVAFAFTADLLSSFLVFTSLGLGLGLPYYAFCASPTLMKLLPRPGMWMVRLKQILAIPLFATVIWLIWVYSIQSRASAEHSSYTDTYGQSWIPFSEGRIAELRAENRSIYVDYTAAWCITCQVNKHVVFSSEHVRQKLRDNSFVLVRADWTNPSSEIEASIKSHGKAGVPLNIVYKPGQSPNILPSVLTPGIVLDALGQ